MEALKKPLHVTVGIQNQLPPPPGTIETRLFVRESGGRRCWLCGLKKNNEQIGALWEGVGILRLWKRCGRDPSWLLGWAAGLLLGCCWAADPSGTLEY